MRRGAAALTVLASALVLLACGGGDSNDSSSGDFADQANQACVTQAKAASVVNQSPNGLLLNQEQAIANTQAKLAAEQEEVADLQAIEPPSDVKPAFDKFVSLNQQLADARQQLLSDFQANDQAAATPDTLKFNSLAESSGKAATSLGLDACAEKLPPDQVAELTSTIEANETTPDPDLCTEYLTPNGLKTAPGVTTASASLANCRKAQTPIYAARSVDVTDVTGVDGVSASADVAFHGGPNDGDTFVYELVMVDGKWKIDYSAPK